MLYQFYVKDEQYKEAKKVGKRNAKNIFKRVEGSTFNFQDILGEALTDWIKKNRKEYVNGL
jgi:hypothetical protein